MVNRLFCFFCLMAFPLFMEKAFAQTAAQRCKWIKYSKENFSLDTLSIIPASIAIQKPTDKQLKIEYNLSTNQAKFLNDSLILDSVLVCYTVLPFNLAKIDFKRNPQLYDSTDRYTEEFFYKQNPNEEQREEIFELKGLNKTGNLTRGVSFGNTQNVFVNSALNLQLDGKLSEEISITAAISDQNIPYQPEGNTLQLQEFDKVFIRLNHKNGSLTAGDVVLQHKENYFLKFYKNVQGASLETNYLIQKKYKSQTNVGIALAKGKFASILIPAIESVQGPYRLTGPNNERFIIVLANSEKVFIDGKQLNRGFNNDYVIDYNNAEIIFNNNIVITQFTRIRVDFEYAERNYSRTITTASHYQSLGKTDVFLNYYRESDNPKNPLINISDAQKQALSLAGDLSGQISGVDSIGFSTAEILYRKTDTTTANGSFPDVYVYSINPENAFYRITFTEVGQGNGDYVRLQTTINGQVYVWQSPINGVKQGNYAPVQIIPTPTSKQMLTTGIHFKLNKKEKIFAEIAFSNQDLNRYATLENSDNQGFAYKLGYQNEGQKINFIKDYEWFGSVDYERNSQYFRPIDRFRSIEYDRDWSLNSDSARFNDNIYNLQVGIRKNTSNYVQYRFTGRQRGTQADGFQQALEINQNLAKLLIQARLFWLANKQDTLFSDWRRLSLDISYPFKKLQIGYRSILDKNKVLKINTDSVRSTAMNFDEFVLYLKSTDSSKVRYSLDFSHRLDNIPMEGRLMKNLEANTVNFSLNSSIRENQQLNLIFTYRNAKNLLNSTQSDLNNVMGRVDWNANVYAKHIRSELTFATATGRELQREFVFLLVQTGQGTHTWRDENEDGIQDLNEFYLAINPDERTHIKVFTPTAAYITAFSNNFSYRLNWQMPRNWQKKKGIKGFLSKISSISAWTINRRFTDESLSARLVPFLELAENQLLSTQDILRSTVF